MIDIRSISMFLGGCALAGVAWSLAWPAHEGPPSHPPEKLLEVDKEKTPSVGLKQRIRELSEATTDEDRMAAINHINRFPPSELREALERENLVDNRKLTWVAKVLLIRWAEKSGEEATEWAWKRFRSLGIWNHAFREIGPAWASHAPASFGAWVKERTQRERTHDISKIAAEEADYPLLDFDNLTRSSRWLMSEDPRLAYQILCLRGGWSSGDTHFADPLKSVEQVRQALSAFDDLDQMKPGSFQGNQIYVLEILERWKELDLESFKQSSLARLVMQQSENPRVQEVAEFVNYSPSKRVELAVEASAEPDLTLRGQIYHVIARQWAIVDPEANAAWIDSLPDESKSSLYKASVSASAPEQLDLTLSLAGKLPPIQREASIAEAFDAWTKAHPGERAERSGWPESRVAAWEDLEALQAPHGQ